MGNGLAAEGAAQGDRGSPPDVLVPGIEDADDRKSRARQAIIAAITTMLPTGLRLLNLNEEFAALGESIKASAVQNVPFHGMPTAAALANADLLCMCGVFDLAPNMMATVTRAVEAGRPVVSYVRCREIAPQSDDTVCRYSIDEFEAEVTATGMEIALRLVFAEGMISLLLPPGAGSTAWWKAPEAAALIRRHHIRGERQFAKFRQEYGPLWLFASEQWRRRAEVAASMLPANAAIMDVGCGAMYLQRAAAPRFYLPIDREAGVEIIRPLNLNQDDIPLDWYHEVDVVACLGVFEYLDEPERVIRDAARCGKAMLISYNQKTSFSKTAARQRGSSFSIEELEDIFAEYGFSIAQKVPFGGTQILWRLEPPRQKRAR